MGTALRAAVRPSMLLDVDGVGQVDLENLLDLGLAAVAAAFAVALIDQEFVIVEGARFR